MENHVLVFLDIKAKDEKVKADETRSQIKKFEEDFLQKEWDKRNNFTFLEDERPIKFVLNIESKKWATTKSIS